MNDAFFTFSQGLQLAALGPCLFVLAFLLLVARPLRHAAVPALYFFSLTCSFLLPLLPTITHEARWELQALLLFGQSLSAALCFLLVLQLIHHRVPPLLYWSILAAPLLGGTSFIYGTLFMEEVCLPVLAQPHCLAPGPLMSLYDILMAALIFLLLTAHLIRRQGRAETRPSRHAYRLIVALIALHLTLMAVELLQLAGTMRTEDAALATVLVRIAFLYLIPTSLFRLYGSPIHVDTRLIPTLAQVTRRTDDDAALAGRLEELMRRDGLYRRSGLTREELARMAGLPEQVVSRVINQHLGKNFNEFVNAFRLAEAKHRLREEDGPINSIAYGVGFNSIASFNRVFKQATGFSPSQFRQQPGGADPPGTPVE